MKTKTLLIIGAGIDQVPAIKRGKELGCRVITSDMNPNAPGFSYADSYRIISTDDKEGNLSYAKDENIDGLMTLCSETAVPVVAFIGEQLRLTTISQKTAYLATNKNAMRDVCRCNNIPVPASSAIQSYQEFKSFIAKHNTPVVIKPSDCSGQRATTLVHEKDDFRVLLAEAIHYSTDGYAIVEEFISGIEINVTAVIIDSEVTILSLSERVTASYPYFGIAVEHIAPTNLSESMTRIVSDIAVRSIQAIGLTNGIAYPQIMVGPDGAFLVEIAARIPGGYMREVALYLSGVDMIDVAISQALGGTKKINSFLSHKKYPAVSVRFLTELSLSSNTSNFPGINTLHDIMEGKGIKYWRCNLDKNDPVPKLNSSSARFGVIIAVGDSRTLAQQYSRTAEHYLGIN